MQVGAEGSSLRFAATFNLGLPNLFQEVRDVKEFRPFSEIHRRGHPPPGPTYQTDSTKYS